MSASSLTNPSSHDCSARAQQLFNEHLYQHHRRIDRMFVVLMVTQWAFAVGCAVWLTPFTWDGAVRSVHPHVWLAAILGGLLTVTVLYQGLLCAGNGSPGT